MNKLFKISGIFVLGMVVGIGRGNCSEETSIKEGNTKPSENIGNLGGPDAPTIVQPILSEAEKQEIDEKVAEKVKKKFEEQANLEKANNGATTQMFALTKGLENLEGKPYEHDIKVPRYMMHNLLFTLVQGDQSYTLTLDSLLINAKVVPLDFTNNDFKLTLPPKLVLSRESLGPDRFASFEQAISLPHGVGSSNSSCSAHLYRIGALDAASRDYLDKNWLRQFMPLEETFDNSTGSTSSSSSSDRLGFTPEIPLDERENRLLLQPYDEAGNKAGPPTPATTADIRKSLVRFERDRSIDHGSPTIRIRLDFLGTAGSSWPGQLCSALTLKEAGPTANLFTQAIHLTESSKGSWKRYESDSADAGLDEYFTMSFDRNKVPDDLNTFIDETLAPYIIHVEEKKSGLIATITTYFSNLFNFGK